MTTFDKCIQKFKNTASLIISLLTAVVLSLTNMSYMNILLLTVIMFCITSFYLYSNKILEGDTNISDVLSRVGDAINSTTGAPPIDFSTVVSPEYINSLTDTLGSEFQRTATATATVVGSSGTTAPVVYIDTTPKKSNSNILDVINKINLHVPCINLEETSCNLADGCIWVNRKSNGSNVSLCVRGDKSGPYPAKNSDGSLYDVDINYYKLK